MGDDGFFAQTGMPFSDEYSPSAPRGILVGIVPQSVKSDPFDGTARGSSLSVWLEELDKMMRVNPNISKLWWAPVRPGPRPGLRGPRGPAGEGENPPHTKRYLPQLAAWSLLTS